MHQSCQWNFADSGFNYNNCNYNFTSTGQPAIEHRAGHTMICIATDQTGQPQPQRNITAPLTEAKTEALS